MILYGIFEEKRLPIQLAAPNPVEHVYACTQEKVAGSLHQREQKTIYPSPSLNKCTLRVVVTWLEKEKRRSTSLRRGICRKQKSICTKMGSGCEMVEPRENMVNVNDRAMSR